MMTEKSKESTPCNGAEEEIYIKSSAMASSSEENEDNKTDNTVCLLNSSDTLQRPCNSSVSNSSVINSNRKIIKAVRSLNRPQLEHKTEDDKERKCLTYDDEDDDDDNEKTKVTNKSKSSRKTVGEKAHKEDKIISLREKRIREKLNDKSDDDFSPKRGSIVKHKKLYREKNEAIQKIKNLDSCIEAEIDTSKTDTIPGECIDFDFIAKRMDKHDFSIAENGPKSSLRRTHKIKHKKEKKTENSRSVKIENVFIVKTVGYRHGNLEKKPLKDKSFQAKFSRKTLNTQTSGKYGQSESSDTSGKNDSSRDSKEFKCDFCNKTSVHCCENCSYVYCDDCLIGLHPPKGPFLSHSVVHVKFTAQPKRCAIHDAAAKLFCSICQKHRCVECVGSICQLHFQSKLSQNDLQEEKTKLLAEMEKLTASMGSLNVYENQIDEESMQIEMSALFRRDQIRQEFISFHELLIDCEELMLTQLDKDVKDRLSCLGRGQETALEDLRKEEANITAITLDLVQTEDKEQFVQDTACIHERYWAMQKKMDHFHKDWVQASSRNARHSKPDLVEHPFSLYLEKKKLLKSIQQIKERPTMVSFKQKVLMVNGNIPIKVNNYVDQSALGPSMMESYTLTLHRSNNMGKNIVVWQCKTDSLKDVVINTPDSILFDLFDQRYLLKLQGSVICHLGDTRKHEIVYEPTHMLIMSSCPPPPPAVENQEGETSD